MGGRLSSDQGNLACQIFSKCFCHACLSATFVKSKFLFLFFYISTTSNNFATFLNLFCGFKDIVIIQLDIRKLFILVHLLVLYVIVISLRSSGGEGGKAVVKFKYRRDNSESRDYRDSNYGFSFKTHFLNHEWDFNE